MRLEDALDSCPSFAELNSIAEKATAYSTCFGRRRICALGYEGSLCIDRIQYRLRILLEIYPNFNEDERAIGKSLVEKITKLYKDSDQEMATRNCITRLFCAILDCLFYGNICCLKWHWENGDNTAFDYYSPVQKAALPVG